MAENQDGLEKSEEPTSRRLSDARKKGQVPRSRELNSVAITLLGGAVLVMTSHQLGNGLWKILVDNLVLERADIFDPRALVRHLAKAFSDAILLLMPFFGVTLVVAVLASIALGGLNFSSESLTPKFARINPLAGLGRLFSLHSLMELVKSIFKFLLVGGVGVWLVWDQIDDLLRLSQMEIGVALSRLAEISGSSFLILVASLLVVVSLDVPFQLWEHRHQLKMTKQEVKDEHKQSEGSPEIKGRIRAMQREIAYRRMMTEVPKADVVVTNPTHFAVALRYDQKRMGAPVVVAKGADLIARNIRKIGMENGVPVVEAPVLARAIYHGTELGAAIPRGLYLAVAKLLAYVFQLKVYQRDGGTRPAQPEFPVPEELRK